MSAHDLNQLKDALPIVIPLAIAEAFRNGQLGVMDFARYKNVLADTEMRQRIAGEDPAIHEKK